MATVRLFTAAQFVPTKWESAEQKARFANHFVRFLLSGCNPNLFYSWFYKRLSMTFGHIAHYNRWGFYNEFFTDHDGLVEFIKQTQKYGCWGDPTFTYSDVEKAIQKWMEWKMDIGPVVLAFDQRREERIAFANSHE